MFTVFAESLYPDSKENLLGHNRVMIHNDEIDDMDCKLVEPTLELEDNSAGSFSFTLPVTNKYYKYIQKVSTLIIVCRLGKVLWEGRVMDDDIDFNNDRKIYCEGVLAFLNDVIMPPRRFKNYSYAAYFVELIKTYNNRMPQHMRFGKIESNGSLNIGNIATSGTSKFPEDMELTDYQKVMDLVSNLLSEYGGHIKVRRVEDPKSPCGFYRFLDIYSLTKPSVASQAVEFGVNLLDFAKDFDISEICTVVIPLGDTLGNIENDKAEAAGDTTHTSSLSEEESEKHLTCEDAIEPETGKKHGTIYVSAGDEAIKTFGRIEKVVNFDDCQDATQLYILAKQYLEQLQWDKMSLEIKALDLAYLNKRTKEG